VVDFKLPGMNGADFLRHAKAADPAVSAVMITGLTPQIGSIEAQAEEFGVIVLRKPVRVEELQKAIEEAVTKRKT
jgi:CheY-like chemotaxis protein